METPPQTQSFASLLNSDLENAKVAMSPVTNLAHNLSGLRTTIPRTPTRRISWSNATPSPLTTLTQNSSPSDSPISTDSPMFQEGIFKVIRDKKKGRLSYSRKAADTPPTGGKENSITIEHPLLFQNRTKIDSVDESSGGSQESGFAETRSYTSQSSTVSIRSSVFTDDELEDDEDTMFAVDKFVEDDESSEMSNSLTQLITGPLAINSDHVFNFKMSASESSKANKEHGLPMRRCLSMAVQRFNPNTPISSRGPNEAEGEDSSKLDEEKLGKFTFKRPEPLDCGIAPFQSKRRKSSPLVTVPPGSLSENENQAALVRCYSETSATLIMKAVQKSVMQPDLIGDCSKPFALPLIQGRHADLKAISGETLVKLLKGEFSESVKDFLIVDCRYPYEYDCGHIVGAKNIYTKEGIYNTLLPGTESSLEMDHGHIIVFHCEFSSERAPKLLRFLRNKDRELNEDAYPRLHNPEIYVLEGGYKAFYGQFKEFCEPQDYKPMLHRGHTEELKEYQKEGKSKAWGKLRENSRFKTRKFKP